MSTQNSFTVCFGAAAIAGLAMAGLSAPAVYAYQEEPVSAEELAIIIEAAIEALPEDATEEQIQAAVLAAITNSGADPITAQIAISSVQAAQTNPTVLAALTRASSSVGGTSTGGAGGGSGGSGGGAPTPPPPPSGGGGGNSDY